MSVLTTRVEPGDRSGYLAEVYLDTQLIAALPAATEQSAHSKAAGFVTRLRDAVQQEVQHA